MIRKITKSLFWLVMNQLPDRLAVQLLYAFAFKALPDLDCPKRLNEKIAWRKLYQHDPRFPVYADKLRVKDEIERLVGKRYVIETLWSGSRPEDIPFASLSFPYVIKVNHSSAGNIFIRSAKDIDKPVIFAALRQQLKLHHGHTSREWGYNDISPCILVERMLDGANGQPPEDCKFFVYHGCVHFIQVDVDRFGGHSLNLYGRDWTLLPVRKGGRPQTAQPLARPEALDDMIALAEKIGAPFDFVRVDLYATPQGLFFGETTFYPGAGRSGFDPDEWDLAFGAPWQLPAKPVL